MCVVCEKLENSYANVLEKTKVLIIFSQITIHHVVGWLFCHPHPSGGSKGTVGFKSSFCVQKQMRRDEEKKKLHETHFGHAMSKLTISLTPIETGNNSSPFA